MNGTEWELFKSNSSLFNLDKKWAVSVHQAIPGENKGILQPIY